MSDAWDDEGFGPEDDWEGSESVEADIEDNALGELDEAEEEDTGSEDGGDD